MSEAPFTVNTLLGLPDKDFTEQVVNAGNGQEETQSPTSKGVHGLQWKFIEKEIRRKAGELLNVDVLEVIVSAWRGSKVMERLQQENKAKDGTTHVPVHKHSIYSEMEPCIEIQLGEFKKTIPVRVSLEFTLTGLVLKIEDRKISAIEAGNLEGEGNIQIAHSPLPKRSFGPIDLPARIHLGKGIPLA